MSSNFPDFPQGSQGFDPYRSPTHAKKGGGKGWIWAVVLGIVGVLLVGGIAVCCGGPYLLMRFGFQVIAQQMEQQISDNEVVVEHLGEIQSCKLNFKKTTGTGRDDTFVFDVVGTKGTGEITAQYDKNAQKRQQLVILSATLRMSNGQEHEIINGQGPVVPPIP